MRITRSFVNGASRTRTGDLLGAILIARTLVEAARQLSSVPACVDSAGEAKARLSRSTSSGRAFACR